MSEPTGGTPQASGQPSGTEQPAGQPTPNTPAAPSAAPNQPATPQAPAAPTASAQPDALTQLQARVEQAERAARHHQSRADQQAAQLRALTGVAQPAVDPIDAKAEAYAKKFGIAKEDAAVMLQITQSENAALVQQNQQLQAQFQGSSRVNSVLQAAMEKDPQLFGDPRIQNAVYNNLGALAAQGQLDYLDPAYALEYAAGEWARLNRPWANATPAPVQQNPVPRPFIGGSFTGPPSGYTPMPGGRPAISPEGAAYDREIQQRFGLKP